MSGNGGNGDKDPRETYCGCSDTQAELGRLHLQLMATQRDQMAQLAAERACAELVSRRLDSLACEVARLAQHVAECISAVHGLKNCLWRKGNDDERETGQPV